MAKKKKKQPSFGLAPPPAHPLDDDLWTPSRPSMPPLGAYGPADDVLDPSIFGVTTPDLPFMETEAGPIPPPIDLSGFEAPVDPMGSLEAGPAPPSSADILALMEPEIRMDPAILEPELPHQIDLDVAEEVLQGEFESPKNARDVDPNSKRDQETIRKTIKDHLAENNRERRKLTALRGISEGLGKIQAQTAGHILTGTPTPPPFIAEDTRVALGQLDDRQQGTQMAQALQSLGINIPPDMPMSVVEKMMPTLGRMMQMQAMQEASQGAAAIELEKEREQELAGLSDKFFQDTLAKNLRGSIHALENASLKLHEDSSSQEIITAMNMLLKGSGERSLTDKDRAFMIRRLGLLGFKDLVKGFFISNVTPEVRDNIKKVLEDTLQNSREQLVEYAQERASAFKKSRKSFDFSDQEILQTLIGRDEAADAMGGQDMVHPEHGEDFIIGDIEAAKAQGWRLR